MFFDFFISCFSRNRANKVRCKAFCNPRLALSKVRFLSPSANKRRSFSMAKGVVAFNPNSGWIVYKSPTIIFKRSLISFFKSEIACKATTSSLTTFTFSANGSNCFVSKSLRSIKLLKGDLLQVLLSLAISRRALISIKEIFSLSFRILVNSLFSLLPAKILKS